MPGIARDGVALLARSGGARVSPGAADGKAEQVAETAEVPRERRPADERDGALMLVRHTALTAFRRRQQLAGQPDDGGRPVTAAISRAGAIRDDALAAMGRLAGFRGSTGSASFRPRGRYASMPRSQKPGRVHLGHNLTVERETRIGSDVRCSPGSHITSSCVLADHVFLGAGVRTVNDRYLIWRDPQREPELLAPRFEQGAKVESGSIILAAVTIGLVSRVHVSGEPVPGDTYDAQVHRKPA